MCTGMCGLMWLSPAYADDCDDLDHNQTWIETFDQLNEALDKENYDDALRYSRKLEEICELSPILNYTIAYIHKNKGDNEKYLFYLQKSTQNTERFLVDKNLLDRIWSDKYIAAHPEAAPEAIEKYQATIGEQKAHIDSLDLALHDQSIKFEFMQGSLSDSVALYKKLMWTGIGTGIGGAVIVGIGAALVAVSKDKSIEITDSRVNHPIRYKDNQTWLTGWGLVGAGAALVAAGSALAGVFGYKYLHYNDQVDVALAPNGILVSTAF